MMFDDKTPFSNDDTGSIHRSKIFGMYRITPADAGHRDARLAMREALTALDKVPATGKAKA